VVSQQQLLTVWYLQVKILLIMTKANGINVKYASVSLSFVSGTAYSQEMRQVLAAIPLVLLAYVLQSALKHKCDI